MNFESLSNVAKAELLARVAHRLTICARDTYETGTDEVLEPRILRAYNELLHRVLAAVSDHLLGGNGISLQSILELMDWFAEKYGGRGLMEWAKEPLEPYLPSPENPQRVN